ncbi:DNA polymerase III subunit delta' C-terminal domain-containing protein [Enterobacteriaceae endosymbiont of Donacia sparganii]|uniref:DNA polymerase III subunit delta' C-terminal domain-containing protein n=1 Tax=Enterobacteriaceae endosymbiont of Donacia sparganii TaxID=2675785 RepID=UPI001448FB86|nr:DNA polymerase III subunit delta' C-terminal domain-containing protein [Enterobacteriaceae endosymbiont of Donacia sparganii]QJC35578.1 hypothetical protein GJT98_00435 [Enterobacteriaceae endosymbiont of Donacia sparganii]
MKKYPILPWYPWLNFFYKKIIYQFLNKKTYKAYIFCSLNGLGTTSLIYALTKWIFCTNKKNLYSCSKCQNCILIKKNIHPDLYIIKNNKEKNSISIELIRNIINLIYKSSYKNLGKIIWLPFAKQLNISSSNAILKILEEPINNTWFFIQCNNKNELLPTIYSRCQFWYISPPNEEIGMLWLKNNFTNNKILKDQSVKTALRICNNIPIYAYQLLNNVIWENRNILYNILLSSLEKDIMNLLSILNNKNILLYINWIYLILLDTIKFHLNINKKFFYNLDQISIIHKISNLILADKIFLMIKKILFYKNILIKIDTINSELVLINLLLSLEKIYKYNKYK